MATIKFKNAQGQWEELSAAKLETARNINGVPFDGTQDITIPAGVTDYTALNNKPQINGIEVIGNKTSTDLNIGLDNINGFPNTPTNNKFLRDDKTFSEIIAGSGGYAANVYLTNINSDISGYKKLSYTPDSTSVQKTITANNNTVKGETYIYDSGVGVSVLDAGQWLFNIASFINTVANDTKFRVDVFKRSTSSVETVLFQVYSNTIENLVIEYNKFEIIQQVFSVLPTDRIGITIYIGTNRPANTTVTYSVGGEKASFFNTPVVLRHNQLRLPNEDSNVQHLTSAEKTKYENASTKSHEHNNKLILDNTEASYTNADKTKLNGIAAGAEVNVQSDWNSNDSNSDVFIKNKPDLSLKLNTGILPNGITSARDILVKLGLETNPVIENLLDNTGDALFDALANTDKDTFIEVIKWLISNKENKQLTQNKVRIGNTSNIGEESDVIFEWGIGITNPGQKENKGLVTDMIISDGSTITIPNIVRKNLNLSSVGNIQLLSDFYNNCYYVIESVVLIARISSIAQFPSISIGTNEHDCNNIAPVQTLTGLVSGVNNITLTANASKALIQANTQMCLKVSQPIIGSGQFQLIIKGYFTTI